MHNPIFAFDFSMAKPAMCALIENTISFYFWPTELDDFSYNKYQLYDVNTTVRHLPPMRKEDYDESTLITEHVNRASDLAEMIASTMLSLTDSPESAIVANEGFAFAATGDAALDLSGYKYILMKTLMDKGFQYFKTYSPISIKSTAGCAKKGMKKEDMIESFIKNGPLIHKFISEMSINPSQFKKKTAYIKGIDDLVDAYWCLRTCINKENISCILS